MFAFFLENAFIGALIWGEKRLGPRYHPGCGGRCAGNWLSGFFILATNAFMQHPADYQIQPERQCLFAESVGVGAVFP